MDAAVAGVALWEEHDRTLIAAEKRIKGFISWETGFFEKENDLCLCNLCFSPYKPTCGWCRGCRRDTVWWIVLHSVCCRPRRGSHILGTLLQRHDSYTVCPRYTRLPNFLRWTNQTKPKQSKKHFRSVFLHQGDSDLWHLKRPFPHTLVVMGSKGGPQSYFKSMQGVQCPEKVENDWITSLKYEYTAYAQKW